MPSTFNSIQYQSPAVSRPGSAPTSSLTSPLSPININSRTNDHLSISDVQVILRIPDCADITHQVNTGICEWDPASKLMCWKIGTLTWETRPIFSSQIEFHVGYLLYLKIGMFSDLVFYRCFQRARPSLRIKWKATNQTMSGLDVVEVKVQSDSFKGSYRGVKAELFGDVVIRC